MNAPPAKPRPKSLKRFAIALGAAVLLLAAAAGCTTVGYYSQAVRGHFALLAAARPIDDWLRDPAAPESLKQRLLRARVMRDFAVRELGLPDNGSYREYADLERPAVVWNLFATPELSLELKTWCYPFFGCATYRGYFAKGDAERHGAELRTQGFDVNVAPVPAYSTLGWFDDPLLNTFIHYGEGELARLIFHELAHQVVYARDDTVFNESFATAVEREGVRRWLAAQGDGETRAAYARFEARHSDFLQLLLAHRKQLAAVFASTASDAEKRARKVAVFAQLQSEYQRLKAERWDGWPGYDRFFAQDLNTAHLAAVAAYNDLVPAFERLLAGVDGDLAKFYREVAKLAALPKGERERRLNGA